MAVFAFCRCHNEDSQLCSEWDPAHAKHTQREWPQIYSRSKRSSLGFLNSKLCFCLLNASCPVFTWLQMFSSSCAFSVAIKAAVLIQRWFRRYMAHLEMRRRYTWNIFQSIEYASEQDQLQVSSQFRLFPFGFFHVKLFSFLSSRVSSVLCSTTSLTWMETDQVNVSRRRYLPLMFWENEKVSCMIF